MSTQTHTHSHTHTYGGEKKMKTHKRTERPNVQNVEGCKEFHPKAKASPNLISTARLYKSDK